jgi:hypothetical protein
MRGRTTRLEIGGDVVDDVAYVDVTPGGYAAVDYVFLIHGYVFGFGAEVFITKDTKLDTVGWGECEELFGKERSACVMMMTSCRSCHTQNYKPPKY